MGLLRVWEALLKHPRRVVLNRQVLNRQALNRQALNRQIINRQVLNRKVLNRQLRKPRGLMGLYSPEMGLGREEEVVPWLERYF